jgi:hypothetical protein
MNCIGPFTLEDADLLAYADNAASPAVREHVSASVACHLRARELDREQRRLQLLLYRAGCPSALQLGEYHLELLEGAQATDVASHVAHCSACRSEVADLARFMASLRRPVVEAAQDVVGAFRTIRARLSVDPLTGADGHLAPALRGPGEGERAPLVYSAEDVLVTVDSWIERLGQPGRIVAGLVVGPADFTRAEASMDADEMLSLSPISDLGNFLFSDVTPGVHHLMIRLPAVGVQIEINDLSVK